MKPKPIHTKPRMMPASAIPLPCCVPPDCSIWFLATKPRTIATIAVIVKQPTMPHTRDAMANPFVPVFGAAEYGVAGWGGGDGGGAGPRSGSCGGVAVIALPPSWELRNGA
jgi:hypothetical protein